MVKKLVLISILSILVASSGPIFASKLLQCSLSAGGTPSLMPYVDPLDILGEPLGRHRFLLGTGSEGQVVRVYDASSGDSRIRKTFHYGPKMARAYFDQLADLRKSSIEFHLPEDVQLNRGVISHSWIKGVSLDKILDNKRVPDEIKTELWHRYTHSVVTSLKKIIEHHPNDYFYLAYTDNITDVVDQLKDSPRLSKYEMSSSNGFRPLSRGESRIMFSLFKDQDYENEITTFEPKPTNIIVDPVTWKMTWVDPN